MFSSLNEKNTEEINSAITEYLTLLESHYTDIYTHRIIFLDESGKLIETSNYYQKNTNKQNN